ncbi:MAG: hypothetical protein IPK37_15955 [Austwickia sp.]|jgi:hypothetical protein|nr:MAG: hypothetical protein IPK37_15955 [Austwickia sp.]
MHPSHTLPPTSPAPHGTAPTPPLPRDWARRALSDPQIAAGVVDLLTPERDRHESTLVTLLCHPSGRLMQPILVDDVPRRLSAAEKARTLEGLLHAASTFGASVVFAVGARRSRLTAEVVGWTDEARKTCAALDVPLLGVYLVSGDGVEAVHVPERHAA